MTSRWNGARGALLAFLTFSPIAGASEIDMCIAANEKALPLRKEGKLLEARVALSTCAASRCPDVIRASCRQRLAETTQAIPSIVFSAKDGEGRDLGAVTVAIDGAPLGSPLGGGALVLDPGEHTFRFEAEGQSPVAKRFVLIQGEQNRREEIVFGQPTPPPARAAVSATPAGGRADSGSHVRTIGLALGGVGLSALAVGGVFGALSIAAHNDYERSCGPAIGAPPGKCTPAGVSGEVDAATKGTVSTIAFVVGGLATAGGLLLVVFAPSSTSSLQLGAGPGRVVLSGSF